MLWLVLVVFSFDSGACNGGGSREVVVVELV